MRWTTLTIQCEQCEQRFSMESQYRVSWRELYDRARDAGWAIREDSLDEGLNRTRANQKFWCPAHRRRKARLNTP